ncbi:hypothetical protein V5O48_018917, partial [Marasmius crinis-equi]
CQRCMGQRGVILERAYVVQKSLCQKCLLVVYNNIKDCSFKTQARLEEDLGVAISPEILPFALVPSKEDEEGPQIYSVCHIKKATKLATFDDIRQSYADSLRVGRECEVWVRAREERMMAKAIEDRRANVKSRLYENGFNIHDYTAVQDHPLVKTSGKLSDKAWNDLVWPQIATLVADSRTHRLSQRRDGDSVLIGRVEDFKREFRRLEVCFPTDTRRHLPNPQTVCLFPPCRDLLILPSCVEVTREDFRRREGDIIRSMQEWIAQIRFALGEAVLNGKRILEVMCDTSSPSIALPPAMRWPNAEACAELAVAQFTCQQCGFSCATAPQAIGHLNCRYMCRPNHTLNPMESFLFNPSRNVVHLLGIAGLPLTTTADQFDNLNLVFGCKECDAVGTWRKLAQNQKTDGPSRLLL